MGDKLPRLAQLPEFGFNSLLACFPRQGSTRLMDSVYLFELLECVVPRFLKNLVSTIKHLHAVITSCGCKPPMQILMTTTVPYRPNREILTILNKIIMDIQKIKKEAVSGVGGAAAGIGTTLGSTMAGAAAGTSGGAAVVSGLATAGAVVGGGMLAGTAVVAAAGAAVGIGAYCGVKEIGKKLRWW